MIFKARKYPVPITVCQWVGDNTLEIMAFCKGEAYFKDKDLYIHTLEGDHKARVGDYIICGVDGEFYPCKQDIFERTYERITE